MSIIIHNKKFHRYPLEIFSRKSAISNCINKNCYKHTKSKRRWTSDFPGCPVELRIRLAVQGCGLDPWRGTKISRAVPSPGHNKRSVTVR